MLLFTEPGIIAYIILAAFLIVDPFIRRGEHARSVEAGEEDKQSTSLLGQAYGAAILLPILFGMLGIMAVSPGLPASWCAIVLMVFGLVLRIVSMRILGEYCTHTLLVQDGQNILETGPYRIVRHPGYLGTLLVWVSSGVAMGSLVVAIITAGLMMKSYLYRMEVEEAMMLKKFGPAYESYRCRTRRLLPYLY